MAKRPPSFRTGIVAPLRKWGVTTRRSTTQRGYGYEWQKLRAAILRRDKKLCQLCVKQGRSVLAKDVDHIVPKYQGGTDSPANLQSLCAQCHGVKTAREGLSSKR